MDSTQIVNGLAPSIGIEWAKIVYGIIVLIVPVLYRSLIHWANERPTTWYWNPVTKKFTVNWLDRKIAKICGRGVNDCKVKYPDNLPDEAKEELKKRLRKQYPIFDIKIPGEKE